MGRPRGELEETSQALLVALMKGTFAECRYCRVLSVARNHAPGLLLDMPCGRV